MREYHVRRGTLSWQSGQFLLAMQGPSTHDPFAYDRKFQNLGFKTASQEGLAISNSFNGHDTWRHPKS